MIQVHCSGLLFDLDGVLVDSTAYVERQWREWAAWRGVDATRFLRVCHGRRATETIRLAAPELDAEAEVARFRDMNVPDDPVLDAVRGAGSLLAGLPAALWAVVTSGSRVAATRRIVSACLPLPPVLVAAEDVRAGKPNPEGYLRAAELLGVAPGACVVIEDAPPGIEAARAAGMTAVALVGTHSPGELAAAHYRITSLTALRPQALNGSARPRIALGIDPFREALAVPRP